MILAVGYHTNGHRMDPDPIFFMDGRGVITANDRSDPPFGVSGEGCYKPNMKTNELESILLLFPPVGQKFG